MIPDRCPACNHSFAETKRSQEAGRRVCADCGRRMGKHDKWHIGSDGKLHHKSCVNPTGDKMIPKAEGLF